MLLPSLHIFIFHTPRGDLKNPLHRRTLFERVLGKSSGLLNQIRKTGIAALQNILPREFHFTLDPHSQLTLVIGLGTDKDSVERLQFELPVTPLKTEVLINRSEERRVGKECRRRC